MITLAGLVVPQQRNTVASRPCHAFVTCLLALLVFLMSCEGHLVTGNGVYDGDMDQDGGVDGGDSDMPVGTDGDIGEDATIDADPGTDAEADGGIDADEDPDVPVPTIHVMTYNIQHGAISSLDDLAAAIRAEAPDLVALQEIDVEAERSGGVDQAHRLGQLTGLARLFRTAIDLPGGGRFGLALLSRFPVLSSRSVSLPSEGEQRILAIVDVEVAPGRVVQVANTVLGLDPEERRVQTTRILAELDGHPDVILMGDFNEGPTGAAVSLLTTSFADAWAAAGDGAGYTLPATAPTSREDFVLLGSAWPAPSEARVVESHASDHRPVVVTIPLPDWAVSPPSSRPPGTLRVMTYNIRHAELSSLEALADVVLEADSDLVGLQEVDVDAARSGRVDQAARLAQLTGMTSLFRTSIELGGGGRYGNALLSRLPLLDSERIALPSTGEQRVLVVVSVLAGSGRTFPVGVTHLGLSSEERREQTDVVVGALDGTPEAVVMGDLNEEPAGAAIRELTAHMTDSWAAPGSGDGFTFPAEAPRRRIDYIFLGRRWPGPLETFVPETTASDHRPIVTTIPVPEWMTP